MNEMYFQAVEFKTNLIIQVNSIHAKNTVLKPSIYILQDVAGFSEG